MKANRNEEKWPIGSSITLSMLDEDPYPIFRRLRSSEPLSWVADLNMWFVTRRHDVRAILKDSETFTTYSSNSTIYDTFGANMLTIDGSQQKKYKSSCRRPFMPANIKREFSNHIYASANHLVDQFIAKKEVDLQKNFSSRLPILTMLKVFGMPDHAEMMVRKWYDSFEEALANFKWNEKIRENARNSVSEFDGFLQENINEFRKEPDNSILSVLANAKGTEQLSDSEIKRNAFIIFFGGISTVEALISNAVWSILSHSAVNQRICSDLSQVSKAVEETLRWESPVQSCTRHLTRDTELLGVQLKQGEIVNCMLGSANRDESCFENPDEFDIDRINVQDHIAFGHGVHFCLGAPLARMEGEIALEVLFQRLPGMQLDLSKRERPWGSEFRKLPSLHVLW